MTDKKKTMYEILEVSPSASYADIKASHKRLSLALMSASSGLSREDCAFKLQVLDAALNTLSVPALRDAYDAQIAPVTAPGNVVVPNKTNVVSFENEEKALKIVAAIENNYKIAATSMDDHQPSIQAISSTVIASGRFLKKVLRVFVGLMVLGFILKMGQVALASRQGGFPPGDVAKAEEKLIIQEYYKKYGVRPASRAEAELLEMENRRKDNEQREAAFAEKKKEEEYRHFVEESRRIGDHVHENLTQEEERARYEEMRKQRDLAEKQRQEEEAAQEAERERIANERRKMGLQ